VVGVVDKSNCDLLANKSYTNVYCVELSLEMKFHKWIVPLEKYRTIYPPPVAWVFLNDEDKIVHMEERPRFWSYSRPNSFPIARRILSLILLAIYRIGSIFTSKPK